MIRRVSISGTSHGLISVVEEKTRLSLLYVTQSCYQFGSKKISLQNAQWFLPLHLGRIPPFSGDSTVAFFWLGCWSANCAPLFLILIKLYRSWWKMRPQKLFDRGPTRQLFLGAQERRKSGVDNRVRRNSSKQDWLGFNRRRKR